MTKTYEEINEKIRSGEAVVLTAEEVIDLVKEKGVEKAAEEVDVVTTGTYGAMCSSGAFLNFGHSDPPIRMTNIRLNGVEAYGGLAAVDTYIGATSLIDPPGKGYGGAHVIEDLIAGRTLYTYMGKLMPHMKNATYSSAGELSPLMNDPHLDVIGMGTRIFLAGGEGYVAWQGTQFNTTAEEINGVPVKGSRTLAVMGDMKQMDPDYVRGLDITGYGISLAIGIGVPIPVLNEDVMRRCAISNDQIFAEMVDYSLPSSRPCMQRYSYEELRSGMIEYQGKKIRTSSMSSLAGARKVAGKLKDWIEHGEFLLNEPALKLPESGSVKPLLERGE